MPVWVYAHLLAWPRDLPNLSDAGMSSSLFFVGSYLVKLAFSVALTLINCYRFITVGRQLIFVSIVFQQFVHPSGIMVKIPPYQKYGKCGHFMPQFDSWLLLQI